MPETTTPASVADAVVAALTAQGGKVVFRDATVHWATGRVDVQMPDGTVVVLSITLD